MTTTEENTITTTTLDLSPVTEWADDIDYTEEERRAVEAHALAVLCGTTEGADVALYDPATHVTPTYLLRPLVLVQSVTVHVPERLEGHPYPAGAVQALIRGTRYLPPVSEAAPLPRLAYIWEYGSRDWHLGKPGTPGYSFGNLEDFGGQAVQPYATTAPQGCGVTMDTGITAQTVDTRVRYVSAYPVVAAGTKGDAVKLLKLSHVTSTERLYSALGVEELEYLGTVRDGDHCTQTVKLNLRHRGNLSDGNAHSELQGTYLHPTEGVYTVYVDGPDLIAERRYRES